jgi:hypothetical protein
VENQRRCGYVQRSFGDGERDVAQGAGGRTALDMEKYETKPIWGWAGGGRAKSGGTKPIGELEGLASEDVSPSPV